MLVAPALILLPLLVVGITLGVLAWSEPGRQEAERRALRTPTEIARADSAVRALIQEKDRLAVSFLIGRPLPPSRVEEEPVAELEALRRELRGDPGRAALAGDLVNSARALTTWTSGVAALLKVERADEAARLIGTEGEGLQQELLAALSRFETEERRLGAQESEQLARARRRRHTLLVGAGLGTLVTSLLAAWLFYRQIGSRLAMVVATAHRLSENVPLTPPPTGNDEFSRLDLTFRETAHRLTETIRQREEALEAAVEELATANRGLRVQTEEMEAFIRGLSHDLRSPLVYIKAFSREIGLSFDDLASVKVMPESQPRFEAIDREIRESLHYLGTAVASAERILAALQSLARAGHRHYEWQTLDVHEIVCRAVDAMHATITEKKAKVTVGTLPAAWGDTVALEQIFSNLLKNAVNYLDPVRPGRVEVGALASRPGEPVTYWVRDNGVGIPAERQPKIFTAFQRIRGDLAEGEGIGLALVHRTVTRLGGQIRVESQEGAGSTFYVTLRNDLDRRATPLPFSASSRPTRQ
ncbi:MAG TPA: HAMP domain-containing sensor histidine kinase [Thermoanaerobaculia bacterium]|jgi:signal transduction histidine kinase|nr:HAMP domain-containing sensor histidine kinase [Thermoanaerobaculia bacterium]